MNTTMGPEMQNCESCSSRAIKLDKIRQSLSYWICSSCGHCVNSGYLQASEEFEAAQEKYFGEDSQLLQDEPNVLDREVLADRQRLTSKFLSPQCSVVEVGPGSGFFSAWLCAQGHEVTLVEHSSVLAQALQRRLGVRVEVGEFGVCDLSTLRVRGFCSFHVIEHVSDPMQHLVAGIEAVEPGGYGFIATPNARSWQQRAFHALSPNFDSAHLRVFSPESLSRACEKAGWSVLAVHTPEVTSNWLRVLSKAFRKLRREDEETTAGKYAVSRSRRFEIVYALLSFLTYPIRSVQRATSGGNEIFLVLQKPLIQESRPSKPERHRSTNPVGSDNAIYRQEVSIFSFQKGAG